MSGPSRWVCPGCGYDLAPRMTRFAELEHRVHHREAAFLAAKVRHVSPRLREWVELVDLYRAYAQELCADRQVLRARVRDLEDEVDEQAVVLDEREQRIAELYADLDRQLG